MRSRFLAVRACLSPLRAVAVRRVGHAALVVLFLVAGLRSAPASGFASSLDASFGSGGLVRQEGFFDGPEFASAVAFDDQHRLLVAGTMCQGLKSCSMYVVRYDQRGNASGPYGLFLDFTQFDAPIAVATSMALDPQGRIVVAGFVKENLTGWIQPLDPRLGRADPGSSRMAVARFTPDGYPDASFGQQAMVVTDVAPGQLEQAEAVAIDADGRIVVAGWSDSGTSRDVTLLRYLDDGSIDLAFGTSGIQRFGRVDLDEHATSLAIDPYGRILVAGQSYPAGMLVVRFARDGKPDPTFGPNHTADAIVAAEPDPANPRPGLSSPRPGLVAHQVAIDRNNRIVVAGDDFRSGVIARLMPNGDRLDPAFGDAGRVQVETGEAGLTIQAMTIDRSNRIVIAGGGVLNDRPSAVAFRLTPAGRPDADTGGTWFDTPEVSGTVQGFHAFVRPASRWEGVAVDWAGRVVVVGHQTSSTFEGHAVIGRHVGAPFTSYSTGLTCPTCPYAPPAVCGNGYFELTEQCDDGNKTAGDGCSDTCQVELDLDADGLLDPGDSCLNAGGTQDFVSDPPARITVTRGTSAETLDLTGTFAMPSGWRFADFAPNDDPYLDARGFVQLVVANGYPSRILDMRVMDDGPSRTWTRTIDTEWRYDNRIPEDAYPVLSMVLRDEGAGRVGVTAQARKSAFTGSAGSSLEPPLRVAVTLGRGDGAGQHGECGESRFAAADCSWNAAGTTLTCQPGAGVRSAAGSVCGFGAELALLMPLLRAWRRRHTGGSPRALRV